MSNLDRIARIVLSLAGGGLKVPSFNTVLVLDAHSNFPERSRVYTSANAMLADGFTVNSAGYKAVAAHFAQQPSPRRVRVGRRALPPDLQIDVTPIAANLTVYSVPLVGPTGLAGTATFTSDASATVAEIVAGLVSAINALAIGITATDQTTFVRLKAASAGLVFSVGALELARMTVKATHADPGVAADLAAILTSTEDFYGVTLSNPGSAAEITAAATWIETNDRLGGFDSLDSDLLTNGGGNIGATLKAGNYFRSKAVYRSRSNEYGALAWFARVFSYAPGKTVFEYQPLRLLTAETLTETQINNLELNNVGVMLDVGGRGVMFFSKVAAGEWIDKIRDRDWLEVRGQQIIAEGVTNASASGSKIPFTNKGAATFEGFVRQMLDEGITSGFLSGDVPEGQEEPFVINMPDVNELTPGDRATRILDGIEFSARVAGAILVAELNGVITD